MPCSNTALAALVTILAIAPIIAIIAAGKNSLAAGEIRTWAARHNLEILFLERRLLFTGPFFDPLSLLGRDQPRPLIFRIIARDPQGDKRFGFVSFVADPSDRSLDQSVVVIWDGQD